MTKAALTALGEPITEVYENAVDACMVNVARHFNRVANGNSGSFDYQTELLAELGAVRKETVAIIADQVGGVGTLSEIALQSAMTDALADAEPTLAAAARAGLMGTDVPSGMSASMMQVLQSYSAQAARQFNLVNTVMLDSCLAQYRKIVSNTAVYERQLKAAQRTLNDVTGEVALGVTSRQAAVRKAVQQFAREGLTGFTDAGGHKWSPEAYAAMDIRTTCNNIARQAVFTRNREYGNDLVSVPILATAREKCYPWQGKIISMSNNARDVHDASGQTLRAYAAGETTYGEPDGLWGINCHHTPSVFIEGWSLLRGTVPDKDANDAAYALSQQQRALEREVRYAKRDAAMMDALGDKEAFGKAAAKVKEKQDELKAFAQRTGRTLRSDRTGVWGYNRSVAGKAQAAQLKYSAYRYRKDGTIVVTDDWKIKGTGARTPKNYRPFAVVETFAKGQTDRTFYDSQGILCRQTHSGPHKNLKRHPYGKHGEHGHTFIWDDNGHAVHESRELLDSERKESADIL